MMGVQTKLNKEECAKSMGRRSHLKSCATSKNAETKLKKEECAEGMGQKSNNATQKDAKIKLKTEEFA